MINEIFNAIYDRVDAQLAQEVFDHVPENHNTFPYIKIDPIEATPNDADDKPGFSGVVQITTFSRYKGSKEVGDIALNIYNALSRYDMPDTALYGFSTIDQEFSNIITADDGLTRHSIQRFRIFFELL